MGKNNSDLKYRICTFEPVHTIFCFCVFSFFGHSMTKLYLSMSLNISNLGDMTNVKPKSHTF